MIINYETLEKYLEHNKNSGLSFWNLINNYIKTNHTEKIISIYSNEFKNITNIAINLFPKLKSEIDDNYLSLTDRQKLKIPIKPKQ